uniref:Uncharacterized protein n=1 Tax=Microviridae sp. ctHN216 TaxID=2824990 RepID=A0A8S5PEU8_9VIRU|nr:MAG TPA: hypothetical protein [Microviridae sp. ctHN216]
MQSKRSGQSPRSILLDYLCVTDTLCVHVAICH